jgi:ketosteroid isomerase-like protein
MTERTTERTRAIVEGYFDAISTVEDGGIDRALAFMTEDVVWQNPASIKQSGIFNGRQAVRELLSGAIGEVYVPHSLRNLGRSTLVEGNRAVTLYDISATTRRGRDYRQHFAIEFEVTPDGKISFIRENFDTLLFQNVIYGD